MSVVELAETLMRLERISWSKAILVATQRRQRAEAARRAEAQKRQEKRRAAA
jgi:hypothetical protein